MPSTRLTMANQLDRRTLERWLQDHGFSLRTGRASGHKHYSNGVYTVTVPGHGPQDLTKKHVGMILRGLAQAGFDRETVRGEWARGSW
jgi:predicted RNA binding protein YcfA (HicA-like mRNA interferase family)